MRHSASRCTVIETQTLWPYKANKVYMNSASSPLCLQTTYQCIIIPTVYPLPNTKVANPQILIANANPTQIAAVLITIPYVVEIKEG